jgi:hypothetical protein
MTTRQTNRNLCAVGRRIVLLVIGVSLSAQAAFTFDDVRFWVGDGENRAALVIDWNDGISPESLAWGYRWDGSATGADMLEAIDAADSRLAVRGTVSGYGLFVDGIRYEAPDGDTHDAGTTPDWSMSWSYWVIDAGGGPSWASSWAGASDRSLSDGSWDGWSFTAWDLNYNPVTAPGEPAAAVPEPATAGFLPVIALGFLRKRPRG